MSAELVAIVQQYGLLAIFAGCFAEGESFAVLGGFLSHQGFFAPWNAFAVMVAGAFLGDLIFYLAGRFFAGSPRIAAIKQRPGFERVFGLVNAHPAKFVLLNRYAYGFRLVGGIAAGMADIPMPKFMALNALASLIWAALFGTIGWFFGLGAEQFIGGFLHDHHRLVTGVGIGLAVAIVGGFIAHHMAGKAKRSARGEMLDQRKTPDAGNECN